MPLGMEVDLGTGHIVLGGDPAPKGAQQPPPLFGPSLLWLQSPVRLLVCLGLAFCVFFWFSLDYFVLGLFAFVVLGLVSSSVLCQEIGYEKHR